LEREQAQALANETARELQLILDAAPASIWFKDGQNRFLRVNQEAARQLGRTQADIEGRHARELFPPWLADKYHQDDLAVIAHLRPMLGIEEQIVRSDGSMGWVSTHKVPWQDQDGERFGVIALAVDITGRKQAEQRLRESEEQFRLMAEMLPSAICQADLDLRVTFLNGAGLQLFGLSMGDLAQGVYIPQLILPAQQPLAAARIAAMLRGKKLPMREYTIVRKDGHELTALVVGGPVVRDGSPTGLLYTLFDLSERKRMEEALRQAKEELEAKVEQRTADLAEVNQLLREEVDRRGISERDLEHALSVLSAAFQSTTDGLEVVDNAGRMTFFNQKLCEMWSLPAWIIDSHDAEAALTFGLPQMKEPQFFMNNVRRLWTQPDVCLSFNLELKDHRVFEVDSLPQRLGEKIIGRVWSFRDVTRRLAAEQALRRSEKRYRDVVDNAQEAIIVVQDGAVVFFNPQAQVLTSLEHGALQGMAWSEIIDGDDRPEASGQGKPPVNPAAQPERVEFRLKDKSSKITKWVESNSVGIEWEGRPAMLHFLVDITRRKEASLALQETLQTLSATLAASPVGIGFVRERTMLWSNSAMGELLGCDSMEFMGQSVLAIYADEDEYNRVGGLLYGSSAGDEPISLDARLRRKDGSLIDVILQTRQIDPDDASRGLIVAVTDISERKRSEEALLAYQEQLRRLVNELGVVEERERRRIACDLHDGLGQDLALMRIKLATVLGSPGKPVKKDLKDILLMTDKALQDAKALTWDLSAPMLRELGLVPALSWLAEQTRTQSGMATHLGLVGVPVELDQTMADSLFRITRELVINAVKHSHCSRITISLTFEPQLLTLAVEDDGVGFDSSQLDRHMDKGFGLFNLRGVVDSWGGMAVIDSRPGRGSKIIITVPLPALITGRNHGAPAPHIGR
jgi:PAS domain S-box-containing protein